MIDQAPWQMEKKASKMTIVKEEPLAAGKVITVDVDPEVLNCPKCVRPFAPPVFQCAARHLICSSCHDELLDKNRCAACFVNAGYTRCFIPTSYSRCHNYERILQSIRVACPNTIYGSAAGKMLYHEKEEHKNTCPSISMAGSGGTIGPVVKMGPCGGGRRRR
ncbi:hypothetical protein ACQ4PT_037730 [Festuca glaucescens]